MLYEVITTYAALIQTYRGEASNKPAIKPNGDLAVQVYDLLAHVCDWQLGRTPMLNKKGKPMPRPEPIPVDVLILCLKQLRKSVDLWTKQGGRQGYLTYILQFL